MATVLLSIAVTAVAGALMAGAQQSAEALQMRLGNELAVGLMEEILALPYDDPEGATTIGPDAGESTRADFDNIDDYAGFTEAAGSVADATGTTYDAAYAGFARSVTVEAANIQPTGFAAAVGGLNVVVTVTVGPRTVSQVTRFVATPAPEE